MIEVHLGAICTGACEAVDRSSKCEAAGRAQRGRAQGTRRREAATDMRKRAHFAVAIAAVVAGVAPFFVGAAPKWQRLAWLQRQWLGV